MLKSVILTVAGRGVGWQESALSIFMYQKFDVIMTMFSHNIYKGEGNLGVLVSSVMVMMGYRMIINVESLRKPETNGWIKLV